MTARVCPERPYLLGGHPIGQYHCPACGCMVMAGLEHVPHDPDSCDLDEIPEEEYVEMVRQYEAGYARLLDRETDPNNSQPRLTGERVWVWMNGPGEPHWAIRGTGLVDYGDWSADS